MSRREQLTDEQWAIIAPLIPPPLRWPNGRDRPIKHNDRAVLNGIVWVLRTGAAWADLPERFPSGSTCFRRFSRWTKAGVLRNISGSTSSTLRGMGPDQSSRMLYRWHLCGGKKRGHKVGVPKRGKGLMRMVIADAHRETIRTTYWGSYL